MIINLEKATIENANEIHQMQLKSFKELLDKYQDYDINPGSEPIDKITARINQKETDYYIIKYNNISVGAIRIINLDNGKLNRISPIFILPEFQNKGIAQNVFKIIEEKYKPENGWILDTILQEKGNCYLYEKIGYVKTGKIEKINEKMDIVHYKKSNKIILHSLKTQLLISFSMLEKIIKICPDELWNKKVSGYIFWQQLVHAFAGTHGWLREDKLEITPPFSIFNGKKIYSEFENDPEIMLTKADVIQLCNETKETIEKWFNGKDDDWLKMPFAVFKINNFDNIAGQIRHIMYHVGHCEAIFRENGIKPDEYLDYFG
jgi:GNAT superfamily N-acetyltransferase